MNDVQGVRLTLGAKLSAIRSREGILGLSLELIIAASLYTKSTLASAVHIG